MPLRELYIDRLRSVMTALVILHHAAITYGSVGGWFYSEIKPSGSPSSILLTLFCATNQAYFMGFFFLLAGYFTPASLERKGYARFLTDRSLRLGVPLIAFILVLGPLSAAMVTAAQGKGFWPTFVFLWKHTIIINGPLWFAQALLMFSIGYCLWRAIAGAPVTDSKRFPSRIPGSFAWFVAAIGVGLAALVIRQWVPSGVNVFGLQLGYFSSYVFLFALGIVAWRHDWLSKLEWRNARPWVLGLVISWPTLPLAIVLSDAVSGAGKANFGGGFSWASVLYAMWEPLVAWGLIAAWLLIFRGYMNQPSAFWTWANRRAYAVYIIHPIVLVGLSLLLRNWSLPALLKFTIVGTVTCAICWLAADPLVRLPGIRRIV